MPEAARKFPWRWSWILPALVLVLAVALQNMHLARAAERPVETPLPETVRVALAGWTSQDLPLGPNEFLSSEAEKVLNYDDVVNREFSGDGTRFGVYVAYWRPGKMPTQLVASHTPDRCWTENGWKCVAMKFKQTMAFSGGNLQPAEWRKFEPPHGGAPVYVVYWHLVGGKVYDYGSRFSAVPDPVLWWKGAVHQVLLGSREQYFIRITSTEPIERLRGNPGFEEVLRGLSRLGLATRS
jgi:hypothetical protein